MRRQALSLAIWLGLFLCGAAVLTRAPADWLKKIQIHGLSLDRIGTSEKPFGYAKMESRWPHVFGAATQVAVCWEQPDVVHRDEAAAVKTVISRTWSRYARIDFVGWSVCEVGQPGLHVAVADIGPYAKALGYDLNGVQSGITLNFEMKAWSGEDWCVASASNKLECIKAVAVHEFGHAIGLAHEQNRPDTPGECQEMPQGPMGDKMLTPWDPKSVMNYCNSIYRNGGATLSAGDIASVGQMYSAR